ncbi:MAG: hypothetical protein LBJ61_06255 [Deltaproteobacteria bacterium]|nr:hypothetical protein [Deltaproteobacteria bacterium]
MTRLLPKDIANLGLNWPEFDQNLLDLTGLDLFSLAAEALDLLPEDAPDHLAGQLAGQLAGKLTAVIPDTSGDGIIEGFSETLVRVAERLGCRARMTGPDAGGWEEAKNWGADFILTSNDDDFVCLNVKTGARAQNGWATGLAFAQVLWRMAAKAPPEADLGDSGLSGLVMSGAVMSAGTLGRGDLAKGASPRRAWGGGSLAGETVLVIGAGPVGSSAAWRLSRLGAQTVIRDILPAKAQNLALSVPGAVPWSPGQGAIPGGFKYILEASTSDEVWPEESLAPGSSISCPGMPFSFHPSPRYRLWAEPLATGTATMLLAAAFGVG